MIVQQVISECLRQEIPSDDPLDSASDYLGLAHDLTGKSYSPLAAIALRKANHALDIYASTTPIADHPSVVQKMKERITNMLDELRKMALQ
jgi:hypothetical protein